MSQTGRRDQTLVGDSGVLGKCNLEFKPDAFVCFVFSRAENTLLNCGDFIFWVRLNNSGVFLGLYCVPGSLCKHSTVKLSDVSLAILCACVKKHDLEAIKD